MVKPILGWAAIIGGTVALIAAWPDMIGLVFIFAGITALIWERLPE